jgi:N-acetylmuramic acid 6-phosphate (MurNAc-6-P) etherase
MQFTGISQTAAARALKDAGRSLPVALLMVLKKITRSKAVHLLPEDQSVAAVVREAMKGSESASQ